MHEHHKNIYTLEIKIFISINLLVQHPDIADRKTIFFDIVTTAYFEKMMLYVRLMAARTTFRPFASLQAIQQKKSTFVSDRSRKSRFLGLRINYFACSFFLFFLSSSRV